MSTNKKLSQKFQKNAYRKIIFRRFGSFIRSLTAFIRLGCCSTAFLNTFLYATATALVSLFILFSDTRLPHALFNSLFLCKFLDRNNVVLLQILYKATREMSCAYTRKNHNFIVCLANNLARCRL